MSLRFKVLAIGAAVAAVAVGGAAIANAATTQPSATPSTQPSAMPQHGTDAHENAEKAVTGDAAAKAQAAAVKAAGGGTAGAVTTDFGGKGYEVTVTKADGTTVEIHLDSSFNVMQGRGGRDGSGMPQHGTDAHENAEKAVTGDAAAKAQAAAVKAAGGGTAGAVTTDFHGDGYEVTVTKADGTTVEIHLDSSFNVMQGPGGPGGQDAPGGSTN